MELKYRSDKTGINDENVECVKLVLLYNTLIFIPTPQHVFQSPIDHFRREENT